MSTDSTRHIEHAARNWLARRDSEDWTEQDQLAFAQWLDQSAQHRVAWLRLDHAWQTAGKLKSLGAGLRCEDPPPPGLWNLTPFFEQGSVSSPSTHEIAISDTPWKDDAVLPPQSRSGMSRRHLGAIAAGLLLALAAGFAVFHSDFLRSRSYQTEVGGMASVPMPDGSKITLNTASEIRVAVTDTERRVELEQGEAFFEVAKDPWRPFVVKAGRQRVVAVGTKFSVRRETGEALQVVVTEGAVRIESARDDNARSQRLAAGAVARATVRGVEIQNRPVREAEEQLSWRSGVLTFRGLNLAEAVAEFNRYNTRKIVIEDSQIAAMRIEGDFRATNVEAFVRLLEEAYPIRAAEEEKRIVLRVD